jgi:RHS repeat-associated protein
MEVARPYDYNRIGEQQASTWVYHLPDALGSVRQLANSAGLVTLAQRFDPFGDPLSSAGSGTSAYSFGGEQRDSSGLEYLRARYYAPKVGRFTTKDTFAGDIQAPRTLNLFNYVYGNPINHTDPSGNCGDP